MAFVYNTLSKGAVMQKSKALVTGASNGIGLVFARELARQGYAVTCVARSGEKLQSLTRELGDEHSFITADLTDEDDLATVAQNMQGTHYSLLVNNAGYGIYERFANIPLKKINNLIQLNITSLVHLSHVFLKSASAGDALINVSSVLSLLPLPGSAVYSGTKAFVTNFTEALWYEYKEKDIYVMALLPGVTQTNFHKVALGEKNKNDAHGPGYPPEVIVHDAISALRKRAKPTIITGPRFRLLSFISTRLLSRSRMLNIMGKDSPGLR
jgi:short-subunit dehydrogenase